MSAKVSLTRRLLAAVSSVSLSAGAIAGCVPAANAPPEGPAPVPPTEPVKARPGPPQGAVSLDGPSQRGPCAAHTCPEGTFCTSQMTPRGPVADCQPLIQSVPGRAFATLAAVLPGAWI